MKKHFLSTASLVILASAPQAVMAQTADGAKATSDDIVVTARRQDESLQKVPVAVSVISADDLREHNVTRPQDIATLSPGLEANSANAERNQLNFTIRGQGASYGTGGSGVAAYLGDVADFATDVFDLQNVQVLKGPQGTLFGRVTTGGAVILTPRAPTEEFEGYVNLRVGQWAQRDVDFGVGGAVVPGLLSIRIAGAIRNRAGFTRNLYNGDRADGIDQQSYRVTAKLSLGRIENTTLLQYTRSANDQGSTFLLGVVPTPGNQQPIPAAIAGLAGLSCTPACPTWLSVMQDQVAAQAIRGKRIFDDNAFGANAVIINQGIINTTKFDLSDAVSLKNIFSYRKSDVTEPGLDSVDGSRLPVTDIYNPTGPGPRILTEELQGHLKALDGRLDVTAGFYYERSRSPEYNRLVVTSLGTQFIITGKSEYDEIAGYAQATFGITDRWNVTGGYRRTHRETDTWAGPFMLSFLLGPPFFTPPIPTMSITIPGQPAGLIPAPFADFPGVVPTRINLTRGTYTLATDYQLSDDVLIYATTRTGYKPGGRNGTAPGGKEEFKPETITDYEIGLKTTWQIGGITGRTNIDVFYGDYKDIQRTTTGISPQGTPATFTDNVAKARISGFDIDVAIRFGAAFDLKGYYTYTDGKYKQWPNVGQIPGFETADLTKNLVANLAKHRVGISPAVHLNGFGPDLPDITVSGDLYYQSTFAITDINSDIIPTNILPGRTLVNLRAEWRKINGTNLSLAAAVQNVTNYQGRIGGVDARFLGTGYDFGLFQQPRTWFTELHYEF